MSIRGDGLVHEATATTHEQEAQLLLGWPTIGDKSIFATVKAIE